MGYETEVKYKIEAVDELLVYNEASYELSLKVLKDKLEIKSVIIKQGSEIVVFKGQQVSDLIEIVKLLE